jgi:hypothetical protein
MGHYQQKNKKNEQRFDVQANVNIDSVMSFSVDLNSNLIFILAAGIFAGIFGTDPRDSSKP